MIKKIGVLLLLTTFIGIIHVFPKVWFQHELGSSYRGIQLLGTPDEENHLIPLKEIYEGNYSIGNALIAEHKRLAFEWMRSMSFILVGVIGKNLRISVHDMVVLLNFILPAYIFLLFFTLTFLLSKRWSVAIVSSLIAVLSPHTFWGFSRLLQPYLGLKQAYWVAFLPFNRLFNPQLSIIPLLLFLISYYLFLQSPTVKKASVTGILLGINFYFYFFWSYLYPFVAFVVLFAIILRLKGVVQKSLIMVAISLLVALPPILWFVKSFLDRSTVVFGSLAKVNTHLPIITLVQKFEFLTLLLVFFVFKKKRMKKIPFMYVSSMALTGIAVMNQQIISGVIMQPHHYILYLSPMMVAVSLGISLFALAQWIAKLLQPRLGRLLPYLGVLLMGGFILFPIGEGIAYQRWSYNLMKGYYIPLQNLAGVIHWFNQNSEDGSVVMGYINDNTLDQIPIYTNNNLYVSLHARHYVLPDQDEFRDRLMNYALVINYTPDTFAWAISDYGNFHYLFFGFRFFQAQPKDNYFTYNRAPLLPQSVADEWVAKYREKTKRDIYQEVMTYRFDYLLYGPVSNPTFGINPEFAKHLTEVYRDKDWILYRVD